MASVSETRQKVVDQINRQNAQSQDEFESQVKSFGDKREVAAFAYSMVADLIGTSVFSLRGHDRLGFYFEPQGVQDAGVKYTVLLQDLEHFVPHFSDRKKWEEAYQAGKIPRNEDEWYLILKEMELKSFVSWFISLLKDNYLADVESIPYEFRRVENQEQFQNWLRDANGPAL